MKNSFLLPALLLAASHLFAQTHTLTVLNGYGSGTYTAGDTVDIWSVAYYGKSYFDKWAGDTTTMNDPLDWHTRLVMPDHDVTVEAVIGDLPDGSLNIVTEIPGADTIKKVWIGFPGTLSIRALVWLFHGTNGSGENFFLNNDMLGAINKMMSQGYAVISLDCEEKTYDQDFNGDDVYRWDYTFDSLTNIDLRNVKAIRDTLISRGWIDANTTHIGYGYSAGGAFATHAATQLQWRAGLSHNSAGVGWVPEFGLTPILYSMTEHDDHPEVGPEAAVQAQANSEELLSRGICSVYRYALDQPLYPERFNRDSSISLVLSAAIFNELKNNNALDDDNYLLVKSNELTAIITNNPSNWPVIANLSPAHRLFVADEIDETYATHRFNSDLFGSDMRFINALCEFTSSTTEVKYEPLTVYPNPASDLLIIKNEGQAYSVFNSDGRFVLRGNTSTIDVSELKHGMYVVVCGKKIFRFIKL